MESASRVITVNGSVRNLGIYPAVGWLQAVDDLNVS